VAIDGSRFKAVNSRDRSFSRGSIERRMEQVEASIDAMQERLDHAPKTMRIRRQTAEHPFGAIKAWMGATHFRLRTLEKVRTEMSLHVLAYNLKRMIAILGVQAAHPGDEGRLSPSPYENLTRQQSQPRFRAAPP
jgi:hypothetical protein